MFDSLRELLGLGDARSTGSQRLSEEDLPLATAALLVEMSRADHRRRTDEERAADARTCCRKAFRSAGGRSRSSYCRMPSARPTHAVSLHDYTHAAQRQRWSRPRSRGC
jgi:uncharacterized tellurite resistance protein B-like protein